MNKSRLLRVTDAIPISTNPTAPRVVKKTSGTHKKKPGHTTLDTAQPIRPTMVPPRTPMVLPLFIEGDIIEQL